MRLPMSNLFCVDLFRRTKVERAHVLCGGSEGRIRYGILASLKMVLRS